MMLKKNIKCTIAFIISFTISIISLSAQEKIKAAFVKETKSPKVININAEINYMKFYLWRGALFGENNVSQPVINFMYKKLKFSTTSNINFLYTNVPDESFKLKTVYDEQDIEIGYINNYKKLEYECKLLTYFYFSDPYYPSTSELYAKLTYPVRNGISIFTESALDWVANKNSFFNYTGLIWNKKIAKNEIVLQAAVASGNKKYVETYFFTNTNGTMYLGGKIELKHNYKNNYLKFIIDYNQHINEQIKEANNFTSTYNLTIILGKDFIYKF